MANEQILYWFHGLRVSDTVRIAQGMCRAEFRTSKESGWQEAEALVSTAATSRGYREHPPGCTAGMFLC